MASREKRPPRAAPPRGAQPQSPTSPSRPQMNQHSISFQEIERGDRHAHIPSDRRQLPPTPTDIDAEEGHGARVGRKKSLVRPDRERIDPNHRQWHYRTHAAQMESEGTGRVGLMPSTTGNYPQQTTLRRGRSLLAREQDVHESGLALFKRGATLRRRRASGAGAGVPAPTPQSSSWLDKIGPGPKDAWMVYCWLITCCIPPFMLHSCGVRTPEAQRAWREKIGLMAIITILMAAVGFLTFGFTEAVCKRPPVRYSLEALDRSKNPSSLIIHGYVYNMDGWKHPAAGTTFNGQTSPLYDSTYSAAAQDASFLFQNTGGACKGWMGAPAGSGITSRNGDLSWYMPCNLFNSVAGGTGPNKSGYNTGTSCHLTDTARTQLSQLKVEGQVSYTWEEVRNPNRNLAVYQSNVLDLNLLQWLDRSQISYPPFFDTVARVNETFRGRDLTMYFFRTNTKYLGACLQDMITVGFIDSRTVGCVASDVVLYISLVFIIGVVAIKFAMAVLFGWFLSWQLGSFRNESYEQRMQRAAAIEAWSDNIYTAAPGRYRPNVATTNGKGAKKGTFLATSRFTKQDNLKTGGRPVTTYGARPTTTYDAYKGGRPTTTYGDSGSLRKGSAPSMYGGKHLTPPDSPGFRYSRSSASLPFADGSRNSVSDVNLTTSCPFPLHDVVPQPPADYQPFGFPLAHSICLVTAYSESVEGLRTTLDSLATTDYPNSHKLILVIADGVVKGAGNTMTTPEIVLSMMKDFVVPVEEVQAHSYVAIADGHKRHNMAKVFAGFYDYDSNTVELSKQQRVPMVLVAKTGNPLEANEAKPGNRGKRDSQIVLMAFLQKVLFDERMTTFEYEFFNSIWRVTGVSPDRYEIVLCVDADTKVFPDSLSRMIACMAADEEIMGLCGETKIANKAETWVTMIQVFEYYISHHLTKAFESMFGGVTCLPGCFSMYRIKAPKGDSTYWVPILANPDIVEHYSENVVDTLHKKNLLLLGEDRYLTTLMLKTFPKRKMMFCPQAVCKTIVPDTFSVLLSQRRRWINSTVHNLAELLLVRDLCGTFCFSMQFVVFMELAGTLVLPAAISFTIYLIIRTIVPSKDPKPIIPLILLGIILGLPGLLIVVTSRKIAYLGWMLIYLLSLPIWNFVLPAYAFWHFDDFSWGQTRQVLGDKGGNHGDKEGEFDSSHIIMKRWVEFERDRRLKSGTISRDSLYENGYTGYYRSGSPKRADSNRHSLASTYDTPYGPSSYETQEHTLTRTRENPPLVMLPAPLAVTRPGNSPPSTEAPSYHAYENSSSHRLVPTDEQSQYSTIHSYSPDDADREPMMPPQRQDRRSYTPPASAIHASGAVLRSAPSISYPGETQNPYYNSQPQAAAGYDQSHVPFTTEPEEVGSIQHFQAPSSGSNRASRGYSLVDPGPVPTSEGGVRRVARSGRRASQTPSAPTPRNRNSLPSSPVPPTPGLPPGAAPPHPYPRYG